VNLNSTVLHTGHFIIDASARSIQAIAGLRNQDTMGAMAKTRSEEIKLKARQLGFDKVGIGPATALTEEGGGLREWLARGFRGRVSYMAPDPQQLADPRLLFPAAKSVVVVALNYFRPEKHVDALSGAEIAVGKISRYAWGDDYHDVLRDKLKAL